jgi:hypothetical protein
MRPTRTAAFAVLAVTVAGCGQGSSAAPGPNSDGVARLVSTGDGVARPDPSRTPGLVIGLPTTQVCAPGYVASLPKPKQLDERSTFELYRLDYPASLSTYRLDRVIPAELDGSESPLNLWPVPRGEATVGRKDAVAVRLRQLVCTGQVPLGTAQREMATDWYAAWQKYVQGQPTSSATPLAASDQGGPTAGPPNATQAGRAGVSAAGGTPAPAPPAAPAAAASMPAPVAPAPVAPVAALVAPPPVAPAPVAVVPAPVAPAPVAKPQPTPTPTPKVMPAPSPVKITTTLKPTAATKPPTVTSPANPIAPIPTP